LFKKNIYEESTVITFRKLPENYLGNHLRIFFMRCKEEKIFVIAIYEN